MRETLSFGHWGGIGTDGSEAVSGFEKRNTGSAKLSVIDHGEQKVWRFFDTEIGILLRESIAKNDNTTEAFRSILFLSNRKGGQV